MDLRRGRRSVSANPGISDDDRERCDGYETVDEFLVHRKGEQMKRVVPGMQLGMTWFGGFGKDQDEDSRAATTTLVGDESKSTHLTPSNPIPLSTSPLLLDWRLLYRERMELERRWEGKKSCVTLSEFAVRTSDRDGREVQRERYEPVRMRITGHSDRWVLKHPKK